MSDQLKHPASTFSPAADHWLRGCLAVGLACIALAIFAAFSWNQFGQRPLQQGEVTQPILFSHRHHVNELKIDCRYCHSAVERAAVAGVPGTQTCLTCHGYIFADSPMLEPLRKAAAGEAVLAWNRVHDLKDVVYFNHSIHIQKGVSCQSCHGEVQDMALIRQTTPLTMGWCLECHRNPEPRLVSLESVVSPFVEEAASPGDYHLNTYRLTDCSTCHR